MSRRTANSLSACARQLVAQTARKEQLIVKMHAEGATLADIQAALAQGGFAMSRSGIHGAIRRLENAPANAGDDR